MSELATPTQQRIVDYLAARPDGATTAELCALLWPTLGPSQPAQCLRVHMSHLRSVLREKGLTVCWVPPIETGRYVLVVPEDAAAVGDEVVA